MRIKYFLYIYINFNFAKFLDIIKFIYGLIKHLLNHKWNLKKCFFNSIFFFFTITFKVVKYLLLMAFFSNLPLIFYLLFIKRGYFNISYLRLLETLSLYFCQSSLILKTELIFPICNIIKLILLLSFDKHLDLIYFLLCILLFFQKRIFLIS